MLEFYPMPTNLSQVGGSLYALQQNHGGARFLDNPSATNNNNHNNNNNNSNCISSCLSNNNNSNNNNNTQATSTASLTAQAISATTTAAATTTTAIGTPATPIGTLTCPATLPNTIATHNSNSNNNNNNNNLLSCLTTNSLSAASAASAGALTQPPTTCASLSSLSSASSSSSSLSSSSTTSPLTSAAAASNSASATSLTSSSSSASATSSSAATKLSVDCSGRSEIGHIKCEKNFEICEGCGQKIHDRYLMSVGDASWHEQCLACCYCGLQLHHTHTCYVRNAKIYCKLDYDRLFGVKCAACCHPILPQELVMRPVPNFVFHLPCFVCYACRLPLQKGEQFLLRDGQLFCYRHDLEKELFLAAAHCGFVGLDEDELMRPRDGRRGPKRPRTILTSQQRKQFKASFDQSPKPCRKVREALAKDTGLSVRVVQVWFQNQRAKMKKIQRKAKNGGANGGNGRSGSGGGAGSADDKDHDKSDDKSIKQELGVGSGAESGYLGLDSAFASQPLNPNLPFSPDDYPANSNDSFCSSDLSLDGSNFDQLDDDADSLSLNNLELQSTSSSGNQHSNPHDMLANLNTSLINPIDKLYLMQNSYFNAEH